MNKALILIDIQNDYFPGGNMELVKSEEAGAKARSLLEASRAKGLPVVHIRHEAARPGATFFLPGTPGAAIHECVAPTGAEPVFTKHFPNSFRETPLEKHLKERGIAHLVLAGMMTHMCMDTSMRAAFDLGFTCTLAHDACATRALSFEGETVPAEQVQNAYLAALHGVFGDVRSVAEICG